MPIFGTALKTDVALDVATNHRRTTIDLDVSSRRRLLYEGAAAEVAGTMLVFLRTHRTVNVRPTNAWLNSNIKYIEYDAETSCHDGRTNE